MVNAALQFCICANLFTAVGADLSAWNLVDNNNFVEISQDQDLTIWDITTGKFDKYLNANNTPILATINNWKVEGEATKLLSNFEVETQSQWIVINTNTFISNRDNNNSVWDFFGIASPLLLTDTTNDQSIWELLSGTDQLGGITSNWTIFGRATSVQKAVNQQTRSVWSAEAINFPLSNEAAISGWSTIAQYQDPKALEELTRSEWLVLAIFGIIASEDDNDAEWDVETQAIISALGEDILPNPFSSVISFWNLTVGEPVPTPDITLQLSEWSLDATLTPPVISDILSVWSTVGGPATAVLQGSDIGIWDLSNAEALPLIESDNNSVWSGTGIGEIPNLSSLSGIYSDWSIFSSLVELSGSVISGWFVNGTAQVNIKSDLDLSAFLVTGQPALPIITALTQDNSEWITEGIYLPVIGDDNSDWVVIGLDPLLLISTPPTEYSIWSLSQARSTPLVSGNDISIWSLTTTVPLTLPQIIGDDVSEWTVITLPTELTALVGPVYSDWTVVDAGEIVVDEPCDSEYGIPVKQYRSSATLPDVLPSGVYTPPP